MDIIQIVFTILLLAFAGRKLDDKYGTDKPWFTLLLSILGLVGCMVYLIRRVSSNE